MKSFFKFIGFFTLTILLASPALASCYVDAQLDCSGVATGLSWTPRSVNFRQVLFNSTSVQESFNSCKTFTKLIKTECNIKSPVNAVFTVRSGSNAPSSSVTIFETEYDKNLSTKTGLSSAFKDYFNGTVMKTAVSSGQLTNITSFSSPSSLSTTLTLNIACNLKDKSTLSEMYSNFVASNGCFFSYDCQSSVRGGGGDRIVITKVPVQHGYKYFCAQEDAQSIISSIVDKMSGHKNADAVIDTMIGDFTVFDQMPLIRQDDSKLVSHLKKTYNFTESSVPNASIPIVTSMMAAGLKSITPFKVTNSIFDISGSTNNYGEHIQKLCGTSTNKSFECFRANGGKFNLIDTKKQLSILKQWPRLGDQLPPDAKYFGYINQGSGDSLGRIAKSKVLETTFGKEIYSYLSKNMNILLKLRTGMVLILTDSKLDTSGYSEESLDENFLVPVVVKGLSGNKLIVVNSAGAISYLSFKQDSFQFSVDGSTQTWIPVGMLMASPWPIGNMQNYRTESGYTQALNSVGYSVSGSNVQNDSGRCSQESIGSINISGIAYKFKNSVASTSSLGFSNVNVPCRGLFTDGSGSLDFTGSMNLSCSNGVIKVNSNNCGLRVYANGYTGKACEVKNGYGVLVYKFNADDSFSAAQDQQSCQVLGCLHGAENYKGQCIFPSLMVRAVYQATLGRMPNQTEETSWVAEIRAGKSLELITKANAERFRISKVEREATILRAYLRAYGKAPSRSQVDDLNSAILASDSKIKSFNDLVAKFIIELKNNENNRKEVIKRSYLDALGYEPSASEISAWNVNTWTNTYENLALSHWQWLKADIKRRQELAKRVYNKIFNRDPSAAEIKDIDDGIVKKGFLFAKLRDRLWLNYKHYQIFGKSAPESIHNIFFDENRTGQSIMHQIASSSEFSNLLKNKNSQATVEFLYQLLIGKTPEASILSYYKSLIDNASFSKVQVAHHVIESDDFNKSCKDLGIRTIFQKSYRAADLISARGVASIPVKDDSSNSFSASSVRESVKVYPRPAGYFAYGPYATDWPLRKSLKASYLLRLTEIRGGADDVVAKIDVVSAGGAVLITSRELKNKDFPAANVDKQFDLEFILEPYIRSGDNVETRVYTTGKSDLMLFNVNVVETNKVFKSCAFQGNTLNHGGKIVAYSAEVSANCSMVQETRVCDDGVLRGSFAFGACRNGNPCNLDGQTIPHGVTVSAFKRSRRTYFKSCSEYRKERYCNDGVLNGDTEAGFLNCNNVNTSCSFQGQDLDNGTSVVTYSNTIAPNCNEIKQTRTCSSGVLSGTFTETSCQSIPCTGNQVLDYTQKKCVTLREGVYDPAWTGTGGCWNSGFDIKISRTVNAQKNGYNYSVDYALRADYALKNGTLTVASGQSGFADFANKRDYQTLRINPGSGLESAVQVYANGCKSGSAETLKMTITNDQFRATTCNYAGRVLKEGEQAAGFNVSSPPMMETCVGHKMMKTCQGGVMTLPEYSFDTCTGGK